MHWFSPTLLHGNQIWTIRKRDKNDWHQSRWNFSEEQPGTHFWPKLEWINFGRLGSRDSWRETEKIQIKLATTNNKDEQQQDGKNNAELQTKWKKTTWKTFAEIIRRGRYAGLWRPKPWRMIMMMIMDIMITRFDSLGQRSFVRVSVGS